MARLDAQRFLLTYSQVPLASELNENTLVEFLQHRSTHFVWAEANHEFHADGGHHFHAIVVFDRRYRGNMDAFDFAGIHPNIQTIKSGRADLKRCRVYIRKDGTDRLATMGDAPDIDAMHPEAVERNSWHDLLSSTTQADFMENAAAWFPKEYILKYHDMASFAQHHYNAPSDYVGQYLRESFTVPTEADDWVAQVLGEVIFVFFSYSGSITRTSLIDFNVCNY